MNSRKDKENLELDRRWSVQVKSLPVSHFYLTSLSMRQAKDKTREVLSSLSKQLFNFHPLGKLLEGSVPRSSRRHMTSKKQLTPPYNPSKKKQKTQIEPYTPYSPVQRANLQHCGKYPEGQFILKRTHRMHSKLPLASHQSSTSPERIGFTLHIQSSEYIYFPK